MKICLRFFGEYGWKLIDSEKDKKEFNKLLEKKGIVIADSVIIGEYARIGDYVRIGGHSIIGEYVTIRNYVTIGKHVRIGDSSEIGRYSKIEDYTKVENNFNRHGKDTFTQKNIFYTTGVLMQEGKGVFYKVVKRDLTSLHDNRYRYEYGKGDILNLKKKQDTRGEKEFIWMSYSEAISFKGVDDNYKVISAEIKLQDIITVHYGIKVRAFSMVREVRL